MGKNIKRAGGITKKIAEYYEVEYINLDLAKIFEYSSCCLLDHSKEEIPKGDYSSSA